MSGASRHFIFATLHAKASSNNDQLHLQYILISTHSNCVCIVVIDFVYICDGPFAVKLIINNKKGTPSPHPPPFQSRLQRKKIHTQTYVDATIASFVLGPCQLEPNHSAVDSIKLWSTCMYVKIQHKHHTHRSTSYISSTDQLLILC